jgi:hypothetical protein
MPRLRAHPLIPGAVSARVNNFSRRASFFTDTLSKGYSLSSASYAARRAEEFGEGRFALLRDQHARPELLREECSVLLDDLERKRWERLEEQERVKQLMREHLELERERLARLGDQRNVQRP